MQLPIYLSRPGAHGSSWAGSVSLVGDQLTFDLASSDQGAERRERISLPVDRIADVEYQRGLFSRRIRLRLGACEAAPTIALALGDSDEIHLMIERSDQEVSGGRNGSGEADSERFVETLQAMLASRTANGLVS